MSKEFSTVTNTGKQASRALQLTSFYGGHTRGMMIQLTQGAGSAIGPDEPGFIQLSYRDAILVIKDLALWVSEHDNSDGIQTL